MTRGLVVAAAVLDDLGAPRRLLAARRIGPPALAGRWELPGGKVDPGEDPVTALHREITEELAVSLLVGPELVPDHGPAWPLTDALEMRVWLAELSAGDLTTSTDHDRLRWLGAGEVPGLDWLPGDRPVVELVHRLLRED